jgi:hypothetical protein
VSGKNEWRSVDVLQYGMTNTALLRVVEIIVCSKLTRKATK